MATHDDKAAQANYSGSAFQADAVMNPDVSPADPSQVNDETLRPSEQTDYRAVDNGFTSVGATDQNADQSTLGGLGVPGVRMSDGVPSAQSGGVADSGANMGGAMNQTADNLVGEGIDDKVGGRTLNDPSNTSGLGSSPADTATLGENSSTNGQGSSDL